MASRSSTEASAFRAAATVDALRVLLLHLSEAKAIMLNQELTFMWAEVEYSFKIPSTLRDQSCPCQLCIQPRAFPIRGAEGRNHMGRGRQGKESHGREGGTAARR